jgi:micrococcal nuclease
VGGSGCSKRPKGLAAVLILGALLSAVPGRGGDEGATIRAVIDGDTAVLADGRRVRYLGINAPERGELSSAEATDMNRRLTVGKRVRLEWDAVTEDRYGRLLAYVYVDGEMVNARLVEAGLAHVLVIPPNVKHSDRLLELQRGARSARRGIWGHIKGPLKITSLQANPPGNDRLHPNEEHVRIANVADAVIDTRGFFMTDRHGHRYTFPSLPLTPGYSVLLLSGRGVDLADPRQQIVLYWQSDGPIWNNDGDTATLAAPDGTVIDVFTHRGRPRVGKAAGLGSIGFVGFIGFLEFIGSVGLVHHHSSSWLGHDFFDGYCRVAQRSAPCREGGDAGPDQPKNPRNPRNPMNAVLGDRNV